MALVDLPWLPLPPSDFRGRARALTPADGAEIRFLAGHALDLNQLNTLAKAIIRLQAENGSITGLTHIRLALFGNGTTSILAPALIASAARYGFALEVIEAPYDQSMQAAVDPDSEINRASPDLALLAFDQRLLRVPDNMADAAAATAAVDDAWEHLDAIRSTLAAISGIPSILQTLPSPAVGTFGSFDTRLPGSPRALAAAFNRRLSAALGESGDVLLDTADLAAAVGLENWHDQTQWHLAKLSFSQTAVPLYAEHTVRLIAALKGKSRKCLVLDLDNTLWGGVIGDDGVDGIALGQGDPVGEAFVDVQQMALRLRSHGVVLAVSSKNDEETARRPFRDHPDMVIQESDIAVFQANWTDKASNLESIATALDIGVDALVLLDDNPAERAQVRQALPAVGVPELPDNPALFERMLLAGGYFETVTLSNEDLLRADDYTARAKRMELKGTTRDLGDYLDSLEMEITFAGFDANSRARIEQLINKSNQFNLTTRRYTRNEISEMETDPDIFPLQVRLRDRFGDNGMICVVICRDRGREWEIDTWLMSCRVLGRGVEQAVLGEIAREALSAGKEALIGCFIPSGRNDLVKDHYEKLGFDRDGDDVDDEWRLDLKTFAPPKVRMRVVDSETA
jgi:FkbH-like protein